METTVIEVIDLESDQIEETEALMQCSSGG